MTCAGAASSGRSRPEGDRTASGRSAGAAANEAGLPHRTGGGGRPSGEVHDTAYLNGRSPRIEKPYANIFAHDSTDVRLLNNIALARPGQATNSNSRNVDVTYDRRRLLRRQDPETKGPHDLAADAFPREV
ncbi:MULTISPECIES: hypothetical protein [Streptomyces]|uniref:hypothetical protein n=1 Tax=Streptomyces TaxID=1883 RepID=UPI003CF8C476